MIEEHDLVVLLSDIPANDLVQGDVGTVVHIYTAANAYEVEFADYHGETLAVLTLPASALRRVGSEDRVIPHLRAV
jgi:hypothetical protein